MMVKRLFLVVPQGFLQFVIVVFPDHTHLLFFKVDMGIYEDKMGQSGDMILSSHIIKYLISPLVS